MLKIHFFFAFIQHELWVECLFARDMTFVHLGCYDCMASVWKKNVAEANNRMKYILFSVLIHHKTFLYELFLVALHFAVGNCLRELKKIYTQWDFWSTRSNVHFVSISIWRAFFCGVGTWRDDRQRIWRLDYVVIFEMHCFHTAWVPSLTNIWIYTFIRIKKLRFCQHKERILI